MTRHTGQRLTSHAPDGGHRRTIPAATTQPVGARIEVLTGDPGTSVVILPGCHLDTADPAANTFFFEDGDVLVGMIVKGGTIEYRKTDRTYVVRLTGAQVTHS